MVLADPGEPLEMLARLRQTGAVEYRYEETRTLDLMAGAWKGKGYLYSSPDGTLIKLQLFPERVIMAIAGERMIYFDRALDQRQSAPLAEAGPMAEQVRSFRAIVQGRTRELQSAYDIRTETSGKTWALRLSTKVGAQGRPVAAMDLSGIDDTGRRRIRIEAADGESTEYLLEKAREGKGLEATMRGLLAEAEGD